MFLVMALNIKDARADRLARELAAETGESIILGYGPDGLPS
jgi:hypothetical protein